MKNVDVVPVVVGALGSVTCNKKLGQWIEKLGTQGQNWTVTENYAIRNGQDLKEGA